VGGAGQKTGIVFSGWLQLGGDSGDAVKFPDVQSRTNRQPIAVDGKAHWLDKTPEVGVDYTAIRSQQNQFARLVGGYQQGDTELLQNVREGGGVDAPQGR
jgi:hypothetical protein